MTFVLLLPEMPEKTAKMQVKSLYETLEKHYGLKAATASTVAAGTGNGSTGSNLV